MDVGKLDDYVAFDNEVLGLPKTLPHLNGSWYMLVFPIAIKSEFKFKSGASLLLPDDVSQAHQNLISAGIVVKQGALCYKHNKYRDPDTEEFKPWCKTGDFVVFSRGSMAYSVIHEGHKFYVMPDDSILYTVDDLQQIDRRYSYDPQELETIKRQVKELNNG